MKNTKAYLFAKQIHRALVVAIFILSIVMAATGFCMFSSNYFMFNPAAVRFLHHNVSVLYACVLGIMGTTGLYLFLFPYLR